MLLSSIFVLSLPFIISQEYIQENCINVDNHNILPYKYNDTTEKYSLTVNTALPFSIINKEYKSKECATIKEIPFKSIQCSLPSIQSHEEVLKVSIGSMVIDLPFKSLFVDSLLTIHENPYNTKEIVFGNQFIRLFNFTVFDYDNKRIELYSDSILIKDKNFVDKYIYTQSMYKMTMTNMIMLSFQSVILALFQLVHKYNIYK